MPAGVPRSSGDACLVRNVAKRRRSPSSNVVGHSCVVPIDQPLPLPLPTASSPTGESLRHKAYPHAGFTSHRISCKVKETIP
jgi:hypothetical protein